MEFKKIKLGRLELNKGQVHGLPANPRKWTKSDAVSLARSMEETPELAEARGAIVYPVGSAFVVLGGNMRVEAARHLGWQDLMCAVLPDLPPKGNKKARDDGYDPSRILGRKTPPKTKRGDLIQLGEHLLICADTKDVRALEKLMGGATS